MVENGDDLDRLLEDALASYSGRDPRAGIERRILRRVRPAYHGVALAALAILCVAGMITISRRESRPVPIALSQVVQAAVIPRPIGIPVIRRRLTRQKRFPSGAPLTNEERALLSLAESAPDQARNALEGWDPGEIIPLSIDEISIPPLSNDGGEKEKNAEQDGAGGDAFDPHRFGHLFRAK